MANRKSRGIRKDEENQGKGKGKKEHDYASMFYYFLDGHSRSNLHVSLPIQDFIRLIRGSWQSREPTTRKTPYRSHDSGLQHAPRADAVENRKNRKN